MPATYSSAEAANLLGIAKSTLHKLIREDSFPTPVIRLGKRVLIPRQALDELIANGSPSEGAA